jgi:chorismate synthase
MSSQFGKILKMSIFGQSHSAGIGVVLDGIPAGLPIDMEELNRFLARRAPGQNVYSTQRREADAPEFLSGLVGNKTCGAPLAAVIHNTDIRSSDYNKLDDIPRPGHADYTAHVKYDGYQDTAGGGHFSGRLTAPLCIAGGIWLLRREGIFIAAHIAGIGDIADTAFNPTAVDITEFNRLSEAPFPVLEPAAGPRMLDAIEKARQDGDSLGGVIECAAIGIPAGLGDPMFDGMENRVAQLVFGIPAVKGLEFGRGFEASRLRGSENNDAFYTDDTGAVRTRTNNHGGVLGGITSGMPVVFRTAFKPTPSISITQQSVSLTALKDTTLNVTGRHDPCIVPRAVPVVEAAAAVAVYDALLESRIYLKGV